MTGQDRTAGIDAAAARLAERWTRLYTAGLTARTRDRRRQEIAADLADQLADAGSRREHRARTAAAVASRLVRGGVDDLSWRREADRPLRAARWQARSGAWLVCAVLAGVTLAMAWFAGGLVLRNAGNAGAQRLAVTAAGRLAGGAEPAAVLPPRIDLASSRAPFLMVYDQRRHVLASSGRLDGQLPELPGGVLGWVARHGEDRITWQPGPGLREAAVIRPYAGPHPGIVLAAQSLSTAYGQQRTLGWALGCLWLIAVAAGFVAVRMVPARAGPGG